MEQQENMTASDLVRLIEGGKLCQGIFLSDNLETVVQARERVIDVKDNVEFKGVTRGLEIVHHTFNSEIATKVFADNIEKRTPTAFSNAILFGVDIEAKYAERFGGEGHTYLSSVHYQLFPAESIQLGSNHVELRSEVINAWQNIEKSIEESAFAFQGHFGQFFEQYGSHITMGPIGFGAAVVSTAFCKGFQEEDRSKLLAVATEASKAALQMESSKAAILPGLPFSAYEVLGQTSRMCAEDLQNITVIVNRIGGSAEEMDLEKWRETVNQNNWAVIRRSFLPKPIWTLFPMYQGDFINHSKLASIMMEEWRSKKTTKVSVKKRINEPFQEKAESSIDQEWELLAEEGTGENSYVSREVDLKAEKVKQGKNDNYNGELKAGGPRKEEMTHEWTQDVDVDESKQGLKETVKPSEIIPKELGLRPNKEVETIERTQPFEKDHNSSMGDQNALTVDSCEPLAECEKDLRNIDKEANNYQEKRRSAGEEQVQETPALEGLNEEKPRDTMKVESGKKQPKKRKPTNKDLRYGLRKDIKSWLEKFPYIDRQNTENCLEELTILKSKYEEIVELWEDEVIYLREVQRRILLTANVLTDSTEKMQRDNIVKSLNAILDCRTQIQTARFPKIRWIIEIIREAAENYGIASFRIDDISQLSEILRQEIELSGLKGKGLRNLQKRLEMTVKDCSISAKKTRNNTYKFLVCANVLQIFCFNIKTFLFEFDLSVDDFSAMTQMLNTHLANFEALQDIRDKQAYVFRLALLCLNDRETAVQYTIDEMPGFLCPEVKNACFSHRQDKNTIDFEELNTFTEKYMRQNKLKVDWKTLHYSVKNQLHFLEHPHPERIQPATYDFINQSMDNSFINILRAMDMEKYYPQKLKYEDVLMLSSDIDDDVNKKPTSLSELPRHFTKHVIGLDSDTREKCHIVGSRDDDSSDSDDSDDDMDDEESIPQAVHPLDLVYVVYLCAGDFLRQELSNKLARCQYAVPLILPPPQQNKQKAKSILLHWGLKTISQVFYDNDNVVNSTLVDLDAPLVPCVSLGEETSWKSKLLNEMLSPHQKSFWHQGLKGGDYKQRVSQGMAEVAWYLPGRQGDNQFSYPVTFVNVRGCSKHFDRLCSSSTVTCIFTEEVDDELTRRLEKEPQLQKVVVVILHKGGNEKRVRKAASQLQKKFKLEKRQVIRRSADDINFSYVEERLKTSIESIIQSRDININTCERCESRRKYGDR